MSNEELKPCPFCGATYEDRKLLVLKLTNGGWVVNHYCETDNEYELGVTIDVYGSTREQAVERWNKRGGAVQCKDCKHYIPESQRCNHPKLDYDVECYDHWINTCPGDSCSYGERRTPA